MPRRRVPIVCLAVFLSLLSVVYALVPIKEVTLPAAVTQFDENEQAILIAELLGDVLSSDCPIYSASLGLYLSGPQRAAQLAALDSLRTAIGSATGQAAPVKVAISPKPLQENAKSGLTAREFVVGFERSGLSHRTNVVMRFSHETDYLTISNFGEVLAALAANIPVALSACLAHEAVTSTDKSTDIYDPNSPHLLVQEPVFGAYMAFGAEASRIETEKEFDESHVLHSRPFAVEAFHYIFDADPSQYEDYLVTTDADWDRIVAAVHKTTGVAENWFRVAGKHGDDSIEFSNPSGIAFAGNRWVVADQYNGRAGVYSVNYSSEVINLNFWFPRTFSSPHDIDAAYLGTYPTDHLQCAVVDRGYDQVVVFDIWDPNDPGTVVLTRGLDVRQVMDPTAAAYARSRVDARQIPWLYVADNGRKHIVCQETVPPYRFFRSPDGSLPVDAYLGSVDVDNYGYVYAVDCRHAKVYLLDPSLQSVIASWGSLGSGANQLLYPNRLTFARGWDDRYDTDTLIPVQLGTAFATETWGEHTGIRRYRQGCDLLWHEIHYEPRHTENGEDWIELRWVTSGPATYTSSLRNWFAGEVDTAMNHPALPGQHQHPYYFTSSDPQSEWWYYDLEITPRSDPSAVIHLTDSIFISRYNDSLWDGDPEPFIEALGIEDPWGQYTDSCLFVDPGKVWRVWARVQSQTFHDSLIWYHWVDEVGGSSDYNVLFTDDTLTQPWRDNLLTPRTWAYMKIVDTAYVSEGQMRVFGMYIEDGAGHPLVPCKSAALYPCFPKKTFRGWIYPSYAQTPCATCCDLRGDLNHDGGITVADLTSLVNFLFKGGPAPSCVEEGNVDGSTTGNPITVSDMTYLTNALFRGGPQPPACVADGVNATSIRSTQQ